MIGLAANGTIVTGAGNGMGTATAVLFNGLGCPCARRGL